jgi:hypothetical protein
LKGRETEEVYQHKREILGELENLSNKRLIDLYYGDESRVSLEPCVPYGWQFADEEVAVPTGKGDGLNCFNQNQSVFDKHQSGNFHERLYL